MANLKGWITTNQNTIVDDTGYKEALALFEKQEERRKEDIEIQRQAALDSLSAFYKYRESFDVKKETELADSGMLRKRYTILKGIREDGSANDVKVFSRSKDRFIGNLFRGVEKRVQFSDEFTSKYQSDPGFRKNINASGFQDYIAGLISEGLIDEEMYTDLTGGVATKPKGKSPPSQEVITPLPVKPPDAPVIETDPPENVVKEKKKKPKAAIEVRTTESGGTQRKVEGIWIDVDPITLKALKKKKDKVKDELKVTVIEDESDSTLQKYEAVILD